MSDTVVGYQTDPLTGEYLYSRIVSSDTSLMPPSMVYTTPPVPEPKSIVCFRNGVWIQDKALYFERYKIKFNNDKKALIKELNTRKLRLERYKAIGRLTDDDASDYQYYCKLLEQVNNTVLIDTDTKLPDLD